MSRNSKQTLAGGTPKHGDDLGLRGGLGFGGAHSLQQESLGRTPGVRSTPKPHRTPQDTPSRGHPSPWPSVKAREPRSRVSLQRPSGRDCPDALKPFPPPKLQPQSSVSTFGKTEEGLSPSQGLTDWPLSDLQGLLPAGRQGRGQGGLPLQPARVSRGKSRCTCWTESGSSAQHRRGPKGHLPSTGGQQSIHARVWTGWRETNDPIPGSFRVRATWGTEERQVRRGRGSEHDRLRRMEAERVGVGSPRRGLESENGGVRDRPYADAPKSSDSLSLVVRAVAFCPRSLCVPTPSPEASSPPAPRWGPGRREAGGRCLAPPSSVAGGVTVCAHPSGVCLRLTPSSRSLTGMGSPPHVRHPLNWALFLMFLLLLHSSPHTRVTEAARPPVVTGCPSEGPHACVHPGRAGGSNTDCLPAPPSPTASPLSHVPDTSLCPFWGSGEGRGAERPLWAPSWLPPR